MSETLPILTVSELSVQLKALLEFHFSHVMVQGEISGHSMQRLNLKWTHRRTPKRNIKT